MKRIGKFLLGLVISLTVIGAINIGTVEAKNTLNLGVMDKFNYDSQSKILRLDGWHAVNVGTFGSSQKYYHYIFLMDASNGAELTRMRVDFYNRDDVVAHCKNGYGTDVYRDSGFSLGIGSLEKYKNKTIYIKSRYTSDSHGDSLGYSCVDFNFSNRVKI